MFAPNSQILAIIVISVKSLTEIKLEKTERKTGQKRKVKLTEADTLLHDKTSKTQFVYLVF